MNVYNQVAREMLSKLHADEIAAFGPKQQLSVNPERYSHWAFTNSQRRRILLHEYLGGFDIYRRVTDSNSLEKTTEAVEAYRDS